MTIEGVDAPARPAVPRHRDAEPDRVRGHVPAPGGAARPLPAAHDGRLPGARRRDRGARPPDRAPGGRGRPEHRSSTARPCSGCSRRSSSVHVAESVRSYCVDLVAATRTSPNVAVGASPRGSLALLKLVPCEGRALRTRLRAPGRREGRCGRRARTPARTPARALGAAGLRRGRRSRGARQHPDSEGRGRHGSPMRRAASPRLEAYAVLAGAGLVAALALRRPELAVVVAPFALVLAAGLRGGEAPRLDVSFSLDDERVVEGEEVGASIVVRTDERDRPARAPTRPSRRCRGRRRRRCGRAQARSGRGAGAARRASLLALGALRRRRARAPLPELPPHRRVGADGSSAHSA